MPARAQTNPDLDSFLSKHPLASLGWSSVNCHACRECGGDMGTCLEDLGGFQMQRGWSPGLVVPSVGAPVGQGLFEPAF